MGETSQQLANQLFHLLVMLCDKGKPVPIVMGTTSENGFAVYRALRLEYEPNIGGRHAAMLANLIQPESWKDMDLDKFRTTCLAWEVACTRYETQTGEKLSQPLKIAVVARYSPEEVRKAIRTAQRTIGDSYPALRGTIQDYLTGGQKFSGSSSGGLTPWVTTTTSGPTEIEIDALSWDRFGKGDYKGDYKGKSCGKGRRQEPWNKEGKKGDPKGKQGEKNGAGKQNTARETTSYQGYCSNPNCGKWGHKYKDCWAVGGGRTKAHPTAMPVPVRAISHLPVH